MPSRSKASDPNLLKPAKARVRQPPRRAEGFSGKSLEAGILELAVAGKLARASQAAIRTQRRLRLPITFQRARQIIKRHADGREEVLATVAPAPHTLPHGIKIICG